jgi:hypothetical protein
MSIHVISSVFISNKLLKNVCSELYRYFIHRVLQRNDDSISCVAHFVTVLIALDKVKISQFVTENYKLVTLLTILKLIE